jgi:hypothetical protein
MASEKVKTCCGIRILGGGAMLILYTLLVYYCMINCLSKKWNMNERERERES